MNVPDIGEVIVGGGESNYIMSHSHTPLIDNKNKIYNTGAASFDETVPYPDTVSFLVLGPDGKGQLHELVEEEGKVRAKALEIPCATHLR